MFGPVRAIIIDDIPSHLITISAGLSKAGIPCTSYWYDREEIKFKDKIKPSPPASGHEFLRVIFSDLNLEEIPLSKGIAEAIGPAMEIISSLVSNDVGPYILVFWTGTSFKIDDIRNEFYSRLPSLGVRLPIAIDELDKEDFIYNPSMNLSGEDVLVDLYKNIHSSKKSLSSELTRLLGNYGFISMLSEWESRAIHAAGKSTNSLYNIVLKNNESQNVTQDFKNICALISQEALGKSSAMKFPEKAYDAAMLDILIDSFNQSVNQGDYPNLVKSELHELISKNKIPVTNQKDTPAQLNSMFNIDFNVENLYAENRGSVISLSTAKQNGVNLNENDFSCWEDFFWKPELHTTNCTLPKLSGNFQKYFLREAEKYGGKISSPAMEVFKSLKDDCKINKNERFESLNNSCDTFTDSLNWVLIEVGAACDHAQSKSRTLRYLVGVEVNINYLDAFVYGDEHKKLRNQALELLGPYIRNNEIYYLLVSLKRFVGWQNPDKFPKVDIMYRLRENLVNYLLSKYAAWSMRPGITEFKMK